MQDWTFFHGKPAAVLNCTLSKASTKAVIAEVSTPFLPKYGAIYDLVFTIRVPPQESPSTLKIVWSMAPCVRNRAKIQLTSIAVSDHSGNLDNIYEMEGGTVPFVIVQAASLA
jgi:hypothetical protein